MVQELRQTHSVGLSALQDMAVCGVLVLLIGDDNCSTWPTTQKVIKKCHEVAKNMMPVASNHTRAHTLMERADD